MGQLSVRTCAVDRFGKLLCQNLRDLIDWDVELRGELLDCVAAQDLLQLLGGDRQVVAVADPRFDLIAEARLLQFGHDRAQTALAAGTENLADDNRKHSAAQVQARL